MTETQAKSGAAAAPAAEPTPGSDGAVTEPRDSPAAPAAEGSAGNVIRRNTAVEYPGGETRDEPTPQASESDGPVPESSPTRRMTSPEPSRAESTIRMPAGRAAASPAVATSSAASTSSSTGRASVPATTTRTGGRHSTTTEAPGKDAEKATGTRGITGAAAVGAARVSESLRAARQTVTGAASRGPRRARLHLKRIDPWSVMKFSFAVSLVLFFVAIVATSVLYLALDAMGVFDSVNGMIAEITGETAAEATPFRITAKGVIGTSVLLGAVNMVLFTALATLGAFVYNVCADLVGGIEVTLSEKE